MENEFSEWMVVKDRIHKGGAITKFSGGQIWWAAAPGMQSLTLGVSKNMLFSPRYE